jgi:hypothetical protein
LPQANHVTSPRARLMIVERRIRQAVVVVHGMGEQRPLEALDEFVAAALPARPGGARPYFSRPDRVTDSYESRRYLARRYEVEGDERYAQTEFYEYHWAHLMQGNRLGDLWPTFSRLLLQPIRRVPSGLRVLWVVFWLLILATVWFFWLGPGSQFEIATLTLGGFIGGIVGGGIVALVLTYLAAHVLPAWLTNSFVDVVRYLDTSPRSYQVRREIRAGMLRLLQGLHRVGRYDRIVIVAHSLGSYIAYDAITYLWAATSELPISRSTVVPLPRRPKTGIQPDGLKELEQAASDLVDGHGSREAFRDAQRALWIGLRRIGVPWLITDFITLGSPMYFADQLYTRNRDDFTTGVEKRQLPVCPPLSDEVEWNNVNHTGRWYSWNNRGHRVLYHAAPFAVVRWTNLWFPPWLSFFGDWFGGALSPLFGAGVEDVALTGNRPWSRVPALAHALYFRLADDRSPDAVRVVLRRYLGLAATTWLSESGVPEPKPEAVGEIGLTSSAGATGPP